MKPSPRENAEVSLTERKPVSPDFQHAWKESIATPSRDFDSIDEAMADPIHDHTPQAASQRKVRGVLGILDQLDRETSNRRFIR